MDFALKGDSYSDGMNRWSQIKSQSFDWLKDRLQSIDASTYDLLQKALDTWMPFFDDILDDTERRQKLYELDTVRALIWCARRAVENRAIGAGPLTSETDGFAEAPGFIRPRQGWAHDCIRLFRGRDAAHRRLRIPVALVGDAISTREIATLELELFTGNDQLFHHPRESCETSPHLQFRDAMEPAWQAARRLAQANAGYDVRWRLTDENNCPVKDVEGRSASAAAALGLYHLLRGTRPDKDIIVMAQVDEAGGDHLAGVGKVREKTVAAVAHNGFDTIIVACASDEQEAQNAVTRVVRVASLAELIQVRSQAATELRDYLLRIEEDLGKNALLEKFGRRLDELRVPLRVVPHQPVHDEDALRMRENLRIRGLLPEETGEDDNARRAYASRGTQLDDEKESRIRPEPLLALESKLEMAVLLGDPGSGKTEWLKWRAREAAKQAREQLEHFTSIEDIHLPVFIRLPDIAREINKDWREFLASKGCTAIDHTPTDAERAAAAILKAMLQSYLFPERLAPLFWDKLIKQKGADISLFLDAWDEVRDNQDDLAHCLNAYAKETRARIWLTSRIVGYGKRPLPVEAKEGHPRLELQICPFQWNETESFIKGFFDERKEIAAQMIGELHKKHAIEGMAQNPLLASLLCIAFLPNPNKPPLSFPMRRVEVYERVLGGLLGDWETQRRGKQPMTLIQAKQELLEEIACHFFPDEELDSNALYKFLWDKEKGYLTGLSRNHPINQMMDGKLPGPHNSDIIEELCADGVLVPVRGGEKYLFLHLTFEEYLAARAYARRLESEKRDEASWEKIDRKAWHPAWQELIVMLAGRMTDPAPLLERLVDKARDDYFRHRLGLAALCLGEVQPKNCDKHSALIDRITTEAVLLWWSHKLENTESVIEHLASSFSILWRINGRIENQPFPSWAYDKLNQSSPAPGLELMKKIGAVAATPKILARLVDLLKYEDTGLRYSAAAVMGSMGAAAATPEFLARCIDWVKAKDNKVLYSAATAISVLGGAAATPEFLARLADLLGDKEARVRSSAAFIIGSLRTAAATPEFLARLAVLLKDRDKDVYSSAAYAVEGIGAAAATPEILTCLTDRLKHEDRDVRASAAIAMGKIGEATATPEYLTCLTDLLKPGRRNSSVVIAAIKKIGAAAATPEFLARLADLLEDKEWIVRDFAAKAIGEIGVAAATPEFLARLINIFKNKKEGVRRFASSVTCHIGEAAATPEILACFADLLKDSHIEVCATVAVTAGSLGAAAATPEFLARLTDLLKSKDNKGRYFAALTIGRIGAAAATPEILAHLADLLTDKDSWVRCFTAETIEKIGAAAATPEIRARLADLLNDGTLNVRFFATAAIRIIDPTAATPEFLTHLLDLFSDKKRYARESVIAAIEKIDATRATLEFPAYLVNLLEDKEWSVRDFAADAIGEIGVAAATPEFLARLVALLKDKNEDVQKSAADVAGGLGRVAATPEILTCLVDLLTGEDHSVSSYAEAAIKKFGTAAATPEFLTYLAGFFKDESDDARASAADQLRRMHALRLRLFIDDDRKLRARSVAELSG